MKLQVRMIDTPQGLKVMLCDEGGETLPMQRETVLRCGIDQIDEITVTFGIDGERVELVAGG